MPIEESVLEVLRSESSRVRVPDVHSRVHKGECVLSFDTPFSPNGIYTNLTSWQSFGRDFVERDSTNTNCRVYLHSKFTKVLRVDAADNVTGDSEVSKMGIGIEGGFSFDDKYETERVFNITILPEFNFVSLTDNDLPMMIQTVANAIIAHDGVSGMDELQAWTEEIRESQHSGSLQQLEVTPDKKVSPNPLDWICPKCGKKENLWFNLSDGFIGCGRRNYDGSGGCGAALEHYQETGAIYPLAVKLGTITPEGGDVWSYPEDDMVKDSNLGEHLSHWGIDIMKQKKYEKTVAEMNIELNKTFEFLKITEGGQDLEVMSGARCMGLENLGNSCYMNSVVQVIYSIPEMERKYLLNSDEILSRAPNDPTEDFITQAAKLAVGLLTTRYTEQDSEIVQERAERESNNEAIPPHNVSIAPRSFRRLVGKGHPEFSTGRQQDCVEYFRHLLELMSRSERASDIVSTENGLKSLFRFELEERLECMESHQVRYSNAEEMIFGINVDVNAAVNATEVAAYHERETKRLKLNEESATSEAKSNENAEEKVIPIVEFQRCLRSFLEEDVINGWLSPATGQKGQAKKTVRIKSFPNYFAVAIQRYYLDETWTPKKQEVLVPVPEEFDFEFMRGNGLQENEVELPKGNSSNASSSSSSSPEANPAIVEAIVNFGATQNAAKRAALAVHNASPDQAASWYFEHMSDADINDPLPNSGGGGGDASSNNDDADPVMVSQLCNFGFTAPQAALALRNTQNNPDRAAEWLFSRADQLDFLVSEYEAQQSSAAASSSGVSPSNVFSDGAGRYKLKAIVSHLGSNTATGHYVAHIKKGDDWILFNDGKVAKSKNPPFDMGYLYVFERV